MKRVFFLLIAANGVLSAIAQTSNTNTQADNSSTHHRRWYKRDSLMKPWVFDLNVLGGVVNRNMTVANTSGNYTNSITGSSTGTLDFKNGTGFGADAQVGYFFGQKRHWGIGLGFMYFQEMGDLTLDGFHEQFQSNASNGDIFRQVITADNNITEQVTVTNLSIPLLLKYKTRFSRRFGFTADAGILYNVQMQNAYSTNATFDYEAIYQFTGGETGRPTYDANVTPSTTDYLITKNNFYAHNPNGNVNSYFNSEYQQGYNVGLGIQPSNKTGTVSYATGSVGLLFRPCLNYFLSDWCALNIGGYFMFQPFNNSVPSGYMLTDKVGSYNSALNSVSSGSDVSYGGNLGVRFLFGNNPTPMTISYVDQSDPTACGASDGAITLYGLPRGRNVTVTYSLNGIAQTGYAGPVASDGTVKLNNLSAGYYSDIHVRAGHKTAVATSIVLSEPVVKVSSVTSSNPTVIGTCDGSIVIHGIHANRQVTVNYNYNGTAASPFAATAATDGSVKLPDLCAGSYTAIVVSANNCSDNASDVTLNAPPPVKKREPLIDPSTPILFDFGKTQIHESSLDILEEAVLELKDNKDSYVIIDGHTDDIGTASANRVLSYKRAEAVKEYLKEMGIDEKRLITVGHGDEQPIAPNTSAEGRAKNRRVIMTLRKHE